MNADLRERLRRLGLYKAAAHPQPKPASAVPAAALSSAGGALEALDTPLGNAYRRQHHYPLKHRHGEHTLETALGLLPEPLIAFAGRGVSSLGQAVFLDIETTGLSSAAGTLAFLVGLGYAEGERFVIEQFFLRDPAEEAAMLFEVERRLRRHPVVVSFNGRAFDLPLLESRFTLARLPSPFGGQQHLDLLTAARRFILGPCSLSALEFHLLGVRRAQRDVPGAVIPFLYREYLAAGGALTEGMERVMYHNVADILSMVALAGRLAAAIAQPRNAVEHYAAGRYHEQRGDFESAERCYRAALAQLDEATGDGLHLALLRHLARLLKRRRALAEAAELWQRLAERNDVEGLVEMAKYHEWQTGELSDALAYAQRARLVSANPALYASLDHRIARLTRKQQRLAYDHKRSQDQSSSQYVVGSK